MNTPADKKCPVCGNAYDHTLSFCVKDGQPLVPLYELIGQVLDERYRIESVLGKGGMGVVYKATHIHIDAECAVKVLNPELVANQTAIERFRLEARAAGRIRHPNAVQVTDFGITAERVVYLVMELVAGRSLRKLLDEAAFFEVNRTRHIISQVCAAVEAAHQKGIIHRDLKPDNILVNRVGDNDHVKVLDFGIAKLKEQASFPQSQTPLTQAGTIIGTPEYMSPEQCRGLTLDPRSDVYSIGVMLYEMLCGQLPFTGNNVMEVVLKHLNEPVRPLREIYPKLPAAVEKVVLRALEKDPEQRQATAAQLSAEFRDAAAAVEQEAARAAELLRDSQRTTQVVGDPTLIINTETSKNEERKTPVAKGSITNLVDSSPFTGPAINVPVTTKVQKSRSPVMAVAAVLVIALLGGLAYFLFRPAPPSPPPAREEAPAGMVLIPGGKFMMGRDDGEEDERPAHEVTIKPFYLDKYEVTNRQYNEFINATGHRLPRGWQDGRYNPEDASLPVTHVTWKDAVDYARWAKKRLPTEAEWEYAARGGQSYLYPWGNNWIEGYANVGRTDKDKPAPVQSFEKDVNQFGVYGLAGNIAEWVQDTFRYYGKEPTGNLKVYRGGSFADDPANSTATHRWYSNPDPAVDQNEKIFPTLGFRCAKDAGKNP